ncbi:hypothetical protein DFQ29_000605 [Apophysomyces sp. BC1021]|nr:hypothetical protein DFQ29_000605 [Apophysomyces sp. BC1021]
MSVNQIFTDQSIYLNDLFGIDFAAYGERQNGWADFCSIFCDSLIFWCATHLFLTRRTSEIGMFLGMVRNVFLRYLTRTQFDIKYVRSGRCNDYDVLPIDMHEERAASLDMMNYIPGYIAMKVSFKNIGLSTLLPKLAQIVHELRGYQIVLHDFDITVDCAYISTRTIVQKFLLSNGINSSQIKNDRTKSGDNCIAWNSRVMLDTTIPIRIKVYNKFVQMLESCDLQTKLGSQLKNFVVNSDTRFLERLQQYCSTGMSRIEITIYSTRLYSYEHYSQIMDQATLFLRVVSDNKGLFQVVERLTQMTSIYIRNKKTFAYCHWWNSLTKRMHGHSRTSIEEKDLLTLLANFGFNDRPIHCFIVDWISDKTYTIVEHRQYERVPGSVAITLVPGIQGSFFPYRSFLKCINLSFEAVGLASYKNITIEWPQQQLCKDRDPMLAEIIPYEPTNDRAFDMNQLQDAINNVEASNDQLVHLESIVMAKYKADYQILKTDQVYTVVEYAHATYRNKLYLCLTMAGDIFVRCSKGLENVATPEIERGYKFKVKVMRIKTVRGYSDVECRII